MGGKSQIPGVEEDRLDTEKRRKRRTFVWSGVCSLIFGFVLVNIYSVSGLLYTLIRCLTITNSKNITFLSFLHVFFALG